MSRVKDEKNGPKKFKSIYILNDGKIGFWFVISSEVGPVIWSHRYKKNLVSSESIFVSKEKKWFVSVLINYVCLYLMAKFKLVSYVLNELVKNIDLP